MVYRLVIVDDEEHIREGLNDLVDWSSLGFQVVAKLEDGKHVIELLKETEIDIILSDIKMTLVSGLELAKYVYEHHKRTKMILISGLKEFELVKQAMSYNVVNYLLKPTKLKDIVTVFRDVKAAMDAEREEEERISKVLKENSKLKPALRKQLFYDLLAGGRWKDPAEVEEQLRLADVPADTRHNRCALVRLSFLYANSSAPETSEHFPVDSVVNMIAFENADLMFIPVSADPEKLFFFALHLNESQDVTCFRGSALAQIQNVTQRMALLGIDASIEIVRVYAHIQELMSEEQAAFLPAPGSPSDPEPAYHEYVQLGDHRKQFLQHVQAGHIERLPALFETMIGSLEEDHIPVSAVRNMLVELFSSLGVKLNDMDMPIDRILNKPFYYESILLLKSYKDILQWGLGILTDVAHHVQSRAADEPPAIRMAKEYVALHLDKEISLDTISSHVYLSPDYFSRLFKQHTGVSFTDYVTETRINKAKAYLRDPQYKIYEIGENVGYRNTKYFFKQFKRQTGHTPSEYRRQLFNKE